MQVYKGQSDMRWTAVRTGSGKYELRSRCDGHCARGAGQGLADATSACNASNVYQSWTITA